MGFRVNGHPGQMQDPTESKVVVAGIVGSRVLRAICINVSGLSFPAAGGEGEGSASLCHC